jgi:uncharacterized repeat protein (TIGR01451 family)/LPXTG-motif cell wall-anchored protein
MNKMFKLMIILFVTLLLGFATAVFMPANVLAQTCESDGAYGQTCVYDKNFKITKKVRLEGDSTWKDKVIDVQEGEVIEFRIRIENIGEKDVDDMKMTDILPDELERIAGSDLTEEWNDFEVGDKVTFVIQARIIVDEFNREDNFEKCVVNKAEAEQDEDLIGSDTATVCYGNEEVTELPETGATATELMSILGFASTGFGMMLKRKR